MNATMASKDAGSQRVMVDWSVSAGDRVLQGIWVSQAG